MVREFLSDVTSVVELLPSVVVLGVVEALLGSFFVSVEARIAFGVLEGDFSFAEPGTAVFPRRTLVSFRFLEAVSVRVLVFSAVDVLINEPPSGPPKMPVVWQRPEVRLVVSPAEVIETSRSETTEISPRIRNLRSLALHDFFVLVQRRVLGGFLPESDCRDRTKHDKTLHIDY